jgi:hypothetical protein
MLGDTAAIRTTGMRIDSAGRTKLMQQLDSAETKLNRLIDRLRLPTNTVGIIEDESAASRLSEVYGMLDSSADEPTAEQLDELRRREEIVTALLRDVDAFFNSDVAALRSAIQAAGIALFGS